MLRLLKPPPATAGATNGHGTDGRHLGPNRNGNRHGDRGDRHDDRRRVIAVVHASGLRGLSDLEFPASNTLSMEKAAADLARGLRDNESMRRLFAPIDYLVVVMSPAVVAVCIRFPPGSDAPDGAPMAPGTAKAPSKATEVGRRSAAPARAGGRSPARSTGADGGADEGADEGPAVGLATGAATQTTGGAVLPGRANATAWDVSLVYYDKEFYGPPQDAGTTLGHTAIMTVSIAEHLAGNRHPPAKTKPEEAFIGRLTDGVRHGIQRSRHYRDRGLPPLRSPTSRSTRPEVIWCRDLITVRRFDGAAGERTRKHQVLPDSDWSLFRSCCEWRGDSETVLLKAAIAVVENGLEAAQGVYGFPVARFGNWSGVDREEIEGYQSLRRLIDKYVKSANWSRPLSLAAFGPPGSGKSFGIKEVAASLRDAKGEGPGIADEPLEFNLSQFTRAVDLAHALFKVRDAALGGRIPLVMFDEFDSTFEGRPHGWLKHLLAPTQDGKFTDGESVYKVGRAIFVFVGGVSHTFDDLVGQMRSRAFAEAKGPDFVSRLRGHVNVRGPDRLGDADELYQVRRAVLLRGFLQKQIGAKDSDLIPIDPAVLNAFLSAKSYRHGVRSIEAIVEMSDFTDPPGQFVKSSLPPSDQLDMHTDAIEFLKAVREWTGHGRA